MSEFVKSSRIIWHKGVLFYIFILSLAAITTHYAYGCPVDYWYGFFIGTLIERYIRVKEANKLIDTIDEKKIKANKLINITEEIEK